jgi:Lrp/AsnC family transcriptional regulator, regulator for asnA, asnC and gidA
MASASPDRIDLGILRELQADGRRSFREIARHLRIPEATVRARFKRLEEQGVVRILAFADPFKLGNTKMALLMVRVTAEAHERLMRTLEGWAEVSYLSTTTGDADLCVQVLCRDDEALWNLQQRIRKLSGVESLRLLTEIKVHKLRFTLPPAAGA